MTGPQDDAAAAEGWAAMLRDDDPVPLQLSSSWDSAEAKLYPAVTTRPDIYQRVVTIVAHTVERLRGLGSSTGALLAAADRGPELVSEVMVDHGLSAYELDLDLLAGAALAMRHREVTAEQAAQRRLRLVAEAHRAGRRWTVVEERGDHGGDPFLPYSRLEVEVGTGRALLVTARGDDEFRSVLHGVEELRVDLATGALGEPEGEGVAPALHPDAEAREQHAARMKGDAGSA
jgi:hypothetical protein